jgi:lysyl-tRNA synthetase class 2
VDNLERQNRGLAVVPVDNNLLAALEQFPECAGIALGLDRLLMVLMNTRRIDKVIGFVADRA